MKAFEQAWELLKALPEQRVTAASAREGSGTVSPYAGPEQHDDRDIGTVHPAIMGMLQRLQGTERPDLRSVSDMDSSSEGKLQGLERDYNKRRQAPTKGVYKPVFSPETGQMMEASDNPYQGEPSVRSV